MEKVGIEEKVQQFLESQNVKNKIVEAYAGFQNSIKEKVDSMSDQGIKKIATDIAEFQSDEDAKSGFRKDVEGNFRVSLAISMQRLEVHVSLEPIIPSLIQDFESENGKNAEVIEDIIRSLITDMIVDYHKDVVYTYIRMYSSELDINELGERINEEFGDAVQVIPMHFGVSETYDDDYDNGCNYTS